MQETVKCIVHFESVVPFNVCQRNNKSVIGLNIEVPLGVFGTNATQTFVNKEVEAFTP